MLSRSFERKIRFFYLQLWPWRQFVYAVFASRDIARRTRAPTVEGKGRDYAESAEERRRRTPLLRLVHSLTRSNTSKAFILLGKKIPKYFVVNFKINCEFNLKNILKPIASKFKVFNFYLCNNVIDTKLFSRQNVRAGILYELIFFKMNISRFRISDNIFVFLSN